MRLWVRGWLSDCGVPARSGPIRMGDGGDDKPNRGERTWKKENDFTTKTTFFVVVHSCDDGHCCDDYRGDGDTTIVARTQWCRRHARITLHGRRTRLGVPVREKTQNENTRKTRKQRLRYVYFVYIVSRSCRHFSLQFPLSPRYTTRAHNPRSV